MARRRTARTMRLAMALVAAVAVLAPLGASAPAGAVPTRITLPVRDARDIAVHTGSGRLFVAGDDVVAVRNADGSAVATIPAMYGVSTVVEGGGSMWALLANTSSIARIDPQTLQVTGTWSVAPRNEVFGLTWADGQIFTTASSPTKGRQLVSVAPATGTVVDEIGIVFGDGIHLASSPAAPDIVVAGEGDSTGGYTSVFDVGGATTVALAEDERLEGFIRDLAVGAGGTTVLKATYGAVVEYRLPDLAPTGVTYPGAGRATSVATIDLAGGGSVLATAARGHSSDPIDLQVFRGGAPTAIVEDRLYTGSSAFWTVDGAVALAPTGNRAYAVRAEFRGGSTAPMAELAIVAIGPIVTGVSPRVVGTRGGGTVTVKGSGLALTSVRVAGQATTGATGTATDRTVTVPALPAGTAAVTVADLSGVTTTSPVPVVVRDLGPFRGSAGFADRQHRDFAGRAATPAELLAADGQLAGGTSEGQLPLTLARSAAFADQRAPIIRLYQAIFLRPPDTSGFDYWLGRIRAGRSLTWVASAMANAPEFKTRYGTLTNAQFVDRIYQNVLGRPADASGKAYWVGQLNAGKPRGTVVVGFSQSPEYRAKMAAQVEVTNLYLGMLRRTPTATELAAALTTVTSSGIGAVAEDLLHSSAYAARIG